MKLLFRILVVPSLGLAAFIWVSIAIAATSKEALITQIIREVQLLPANDAARDASVNDKVSEDTGVRTGGDSRSELTFPDFTITRLGANTIFSFNKSGRTANIDSGSILLRVPKNSGGGSIRSSAVTVAITGTTVIFETDSAGGNKLITLEGTSRLSLKSRPGESRVVRGGQMLDVPPGATTLPMPVEIDLDELMRTHPLIVDFKPLPSLSLITAVAKRQPAPTQAGPANQPPGVPPAPPPGPPPGPNPTGAGGSGQKPFPSATGRPVTLPSPTLTPRSSPTPNTKPTPSATPRGDTAPSPTATPRQSPSAKPTPTAPAKPTPSASPRGDTASSPTATPRVTPTAKPTPTAPPKPSPTPTAPPKASPTPRPAPTPRPTPRSSASPKPTPKASPKSTRPPVTTRSPGSTKSPVVTSSPTPNPILRTVPKQTYTPRPQSTPRTMRVFKRPTPPPVR
jgi:hypothetical protein